MSFALWQELVEKINTNPIFKQWHRGTRNGAGKECSLIQLLSLAALRYLGRKCTFDDLEEITFISERTHERFFKKFIEYGDIYLYPEYVISPSNPEDAKRHMFEMGLAGFNGAIGSIDATHVTIESCRYGLRQIHLGHKLSKTARTYNTIVNHRHRILSFTGEYPSRWNDKTLVLFDSFVEKIRSGGLNENEFILYKRLEGEIIVSVKYKGVWLLVDNRYLEWSCTMPPFKYYGDRCELRWSQWLESMRKDVERTFGITKKRFTVLSKGVQAYNIEDADRVWKTCCALHNMLLEADGYGEIWEGGIPSDPDINNSATFAIGQLFGDDGEEEVRRHDEADNEDWRSGVLFSGVTRHVNKLSMKDMREKLVEHFDIMFHNGGIA